ncbi:MAG: type II toxin-antitoxin system death-on-curing family toxin [Gemmatimonadota bacterium]
MPKQATARPKRARVREGADEPRWVTRAQLDAIHQAQLHEHGGSAGARDEGLLESALDRARNKFAYGETDLSVLAAAYAFGLTKNHGFVDGNKRTAFQAMYVFLGLNRYDLDVGEPEVVDVMNRLASGKLTEAAFAAWIKTHLDG